MPTTFTRANFTLVTTAVIVIDHSSAAYLRLELAIDADQFT